MNLEKQKTTVEPEEWFDISTTISAQKSKNLKNWRLDYSKFLKVKWLSKKRYRRNTYIIPTQHRRHADIVPT
jgi:hypothetical protein